MTGASRPVDGHSADRARVVEQARSAGLRLVRFLYCDPDGVTRGKAAGMAHLGDLLESGIGLTLAMQAFTVLDRLAPVPGMGAVGEIRLIPDPSTFVVAPYAPHTGVVLVDMVTTGGAPYAADARAFLRRMVERARGDDLEVVAAFEPEWSLARHSDGGDLVPVDDSLCFSTQGMESAAAVVDEVVAALEAQGMPVEQYYPELGWGQQELSIRHAPALRAADQHLLYRETVRGVARRHGLHASFAPKPWPDQPGNGCHLHLSALDAAGERHRFHDPAAADGLSDTGRHFAAGLLEHLPALVALTCASVNSYRRLVPRSWASAYRVWGLDNREAAVRVPSRFRGREAASTNLELKPSDGSANPHLSLGGVIAAGLDGVRRRLEPPPRVDVDPSTLDDEARARTGAERLPTSLAEALDRLSQDEVLLDALGDRLAGCYLAVKRDDVEAFAAEVPDHEFRQHRLRY
jgi:glutamine synthetase